MSGFSAQNTHDIFIDFLSKKKLNELFHRVSVDPKLDQPLLQKQIIDRLPYNCPLKPNVKLKRVKYDDKGKPITRCSIYIEFYENNEDNIVGYITLHFYINKMKEAGNIGRIHARNTKKRLRHAIKINKNDNGMIYMNYVQFPDKIQPYLETPFQITKNIINEYLTPGHVIFLGEKLTSKSYTMNECTRIKEKIFEPSTKKIVGTRKSHIKYKSRNNKIQTPMNVEF